MFKSSFFSLFLCCAFIFSQESHSQNEYLPPNVVPPSPEAAALFKFTETPVNLSQGMATTEIPIYTIQTKGVTIPISLSYHSRGIKVAELASRVGLGWTLNHGGMISRQVRGKSDDGNSSGYLRHSFYSDFFTNEDTRNSVYRMDANGDIDFDPDLFFFSFPGYNGKFIFEQVFKEPWQQKYTDLDIEPHYESYGGIIDSWTVRDDKGNTFYFGKAPGVSTSVVIGDTENAAPYKYTSGTGPEQLFTDSADDGYNSWHLLKILTYEQEVITFTYEPENPQYIRRSYDENDPNSQNGVAAYYSIVNANQYQIKQINFPGGKVVFNSKTTYREDLSGSYALDNIEVYAATSTLISRHNLIYQDVTSVTNNNYLGHIATSDASSHKRMFLKEVKHAKDTFNQPPYIFEYSSVKLPNRFSNSQDNWGYYNGASNGPYLTFFDYGAYSVDRRVDSTQNSAGLLKKVIFPTGGHVSYKYEQNIAVKPDFMDQTASPGTNPVVTKSASLGNLMIREKWDPNTGSFKTPVSISENKVSSVVSTVKFSYDDGDGPCQYYQSTAECSFLMILKGATNTYGLRYGNNISMSGVPSGEYILEVFPPGKDPNIYFEVYLSWDEEEPLEDPSGTPLLLASGKRIKKITYSDGQNSVKTKEYKYTNPDGSNSGKIFGLPSYYSIQEETSIGNILYKYGCKPGSPLTSLQGNDLGYGYVTEYEGTSGNNIGKIEHEFTNFPDGGTYYEFPYHLPIDNQWLRGKPLRTKIFKKSSSLYLPVKEIVNEYLYAGTYVNSPSALGLPPIMHMDSTHTTYDDRYSFQMPLAVFTPDDDQQDGHAYKVYYQRGGALDLYSTTETSYLNQQVTMSTNYNYDYPAHYQLKGNSTTITGKTAETVYFYPTAISALYAANRIIPVKSETSVKEGTTLLAKSYQQTLFSSFGGLTLPSQIESAKSTDAFIPRVKFHKYDATGNPLEVSQAGGPISVYIWGYDKQQLVAKIENSTYAAVEALSAFGASFTLGSGGLSQTQKTSLRTLSGALVTTYDYKPLVGVTIVTDPKGETTYYEYDPFNRLEFVKDEEGNILKEHKYHYQTN